MGRIDTTELAGRLDAALDPVPEAAPIEALLDAGKAGLRRQRRRRSAAGIGLGLVVAVGGSTALSAAQQSSQVEPPASSGGLASGDTEQPDDLVIVSEGVPFLQPWNGSPYILEPGEDDTPATVAPGTDRFVPDPGATVLEQQAVPGDVVVTDEGEVATTVALVENDGRRYYMLLVQDADGGSGTTFTVPFDRFIDRGDGVDLDAFSELVVDSAAHVKGSPGAR